jgi:hypothetical protein
MERERGSRVGHARKASAGLHLSKNIQLAKGVLYQYVHRCSECREREIERPGAHANAWSAILLSEANNGRGKTV